MDEKKSRGWAWWSQSIDEAGSADHAGRAAAAADSAGNYADNVHFNARQGHGFAAEKANNLHDRLAGRDAEIVGGNNRKDGADRMVDGVSIQTKYCGSGKACIDQCFEGTRFRYLADGKPMQIEVPSDMYDDALSAMRERIRNGQVPGVSDPDLAGDIVRKGHYTYAQARSIARAGTIESLTFDAVNGVTLAGSAMGVTAAITLATRIWHGERLEVALDAACFEGLCVGGITWASSIAAAQLGRTSLESGLRSGTDWLVRQLGSKVTNTLANTFRTAGTEIYGQAAKNHVSKLLRGNIATVVAVTAVLSIDDLHSLFLKEISGTQAFKNIATTSSGVAGGSAGWWGGAALGTMIMPGIGTTVGGVIGAFAGGIGSSALVKKALGAVWDDDSITLGQMVEAAYMELANDHLLNQAEAEAAIQKFKQFVDLPSKMRQMQGAEYKRDFAIALWTPFIEEQVRKRQVISLPSAQALAASIERVARQLNPDAGPPDAAEPPSPAQPMQWPTDRQAKMDAMMDQLATWKQQSAERRKLLNLDPLDEDDAPQAPARDWLGQWKDSVRGAVDAVSARFARDAAQPGAADDDGVPDIPAPQRVIRSLATFIEPYQDVIGDGKYVYAGRSLFTTKGEKKHAAARKHLGNNEYEYGLVVMDSTTWGSVEEGIFITETYLYCKAFLEDQMVFRIADIESIWVDADDTEIVVNGKRCKYGYAPATKPLQLAVDCIKSYLAQHK